MLRDMLAALSVICLLCPHGPPAPTVGVEYGHGAAGEHEEAGRGAVDDVLDGLEEAFAGVFAELADDVLCHLALGAAETAEAAPLVQDAADDLGRCLGCYPEAAAGGLDCGLIYAYDAVVAAELAEGVHGGAP